MIVLSQVLSDKMITNLEDGVLKSWLESAAVGTEFFLECCISTADRVYWW